MKLNTLAASTVLALSASMVSQSAFAEWSANAGIMSDYHFRGIQQTESASAYAGVDFEQDGFFVGTWAAEVEDGLEVDLYGGYGTELDNGLGMSVGFTSYQYTGDFDSAYNEFNFGLSYSFASLAYSIGEWDGEVGNEAATESDYSVIELTFAHEGFYATFGKYGREFDGEYGEFGYGTEVAGFDVGVALVVSGSDLDDSESLYFTVGKTFSL
ncbi:TorF family putative porin [Alteromonas oceanisediminis]|uniref:TorF family putative porin n=1 Tax=Alteromonas oceanisediminis TaxID=2836180 RepID=UPI001BDA9E2B|nr:TorF family putative porin [Alteromonas oceanisediminis]MBT0586102.1 TorF family putative porin [Alteromonas oceanisediminis]